MRVRGRFFGRLLMRHNTEGVRLEMRRLPTRDSFRLENGSGRNDDFGVLRQETLRPGATFFLWCSLFLLRCFFQQNYNVRQGGIVQIQSLGSFCFQAHAISVQD